jgi:ribosomal-protein-alanine N-acetyltransferase
MGGLSEKTILTNLRLMEARDLPEVMQIENASFRLPWSQRFFLEELKVDASRTWVAYVQDTDGEKIMGYVCCRFVSNEASILNIAVAPQWRRLGLGRTLLRKVISEARGYLCQGVFLEVRRSNEAAQKLYRSEGFVTKGVRRRYYSDNGEDALVMVLSLLPSSP